MEDFLRKIQLSENAIAIYLKALGKYSHFYYELYSMLAGANIDQFNGYVNELIDAGLLIKLSSEKEDILTSYSVVPPILPILSYYENINSNLPSIKTSIQELMVNSVDKIFQDNKDIELNQILTAFQDIKKDIDEDSIIQKKEVEDIVEGMEDLKQIKSKISDLHQEVKVITQKKFGDLIKTINIIKTNLIENIKKKEIVSLIEELFRDKFENMVADFTNNLHELIEKQFEVISKPVDDITAVIFQYRNDFKMLLLNMLTNFETHMNEIHDLLKENNDRLLNAIKNIENSIANNLDGVLENSIKEISGLNKPIEGVMKSYFQEISTTKKKLSINVWTLESVISINEAIQNLISKVKETLIIIIPHIENHLAPEQFGSISKNLKIKIAASEAHTNSIVQNFNNINNIIYRNYQNENLIIIKGDESILFFGIIQESKDPLHNFVGIGSDFKPLIELIDPVVTDIWEKSYSDTFHASQVAKSEFSKMTPSKTITTAKPIIKTGSQPEITDKKLASQENKPYVSMQSQIQESSKEKSRGFKRTERESISSFTPKTKATDLQQKLKEKIDFIAEAQPKGDDEVALEINNAFSNLIFKLDNLKGDEFGNELQNIADLILEKKGFSVTLHKLRSVINKFKDKFMLLDANDKREILENIQDWKKKLF